MQMCVFVNLTANHKLLDAYYFVYLVKVLDFFYSTKCL